MILRPDVKVKFDNGKLMKMLVYAMTCMIQGLVAEGDQDITFYEVGTMRADAWGRERQVHGLSAGIVSTDDLNVALVRLRLVDPSDRSLLNLYTVIVDISSPEDGFDDLAVYEHTRGEEDNLVIEWNSSKRDFVIPARG